MFWRKSISIALLLITPLAVFPYQSCAPPPNYFFIGTSIFVLFIIFNICIMVSLFINFIFEKIRKEKRKHFWYQSIIGFLITIGSVLGLAFLSLINNNITVIIIMIISMVIGSIIGYFLTPLKKD